MALASGEAPFRQLYIHTHDVSRSLKPSADGELAHAIHQTLHFALDGHPDDYTPSSPNSGAGSGCDSLATMPTSSDANGPSSSSPSGSQVKKGFFPTADSERPYISYHWNPRSATLALPNPATITNPIADPCTPDHRNSYDITAKFFFLDPNDLSADLVDDALQRLTSTTGIITVDTLMLSFPTLDLDSRPHQHLSSSAANSTAASDAAHQDGPAFWVNQVKHVWSHVSQNPQLFSLGLSDISPSNLDLLLKSLSPPIQPPSLPLFSPAIPLSTDTSEPSASTSQPALANSDVPSSTTATTATNTADNSNRSVGSFYNMEYSLVSTARRPRLVSINVKQDPCAFDRDFDSYCSKMGIQLVAHSDRKDVLPKRTLPALMDEFQTKLPVKQPDGERLRPKWALKYTTLIRDRGVLADKGYIVFVSTD
ncbi:uncharacterized protein MEPE_02496 [Melanopsichium pennsylvanicum]|uniref:Glutamate--cysteine ligase modifier subunit n=2 Tax=Melanopsichium pennsylvanicum TaxID=63383 RepID=A0AAJ5C4Q7_9BASI|nr:conserved hypothetical protein [Melanopsichium pennsylvanicum 4]SNX83788.1 uncharacterized protein MEPE_02496 [Melanopsichium pennsylvanicum]